MSHRAQFKPFLITWSNIWFLNMKLNAVTRLACRVESYHLTKLTPSRLSFHKILYFVTIIMHHRTNPTTSSVLVSFFSLLLSNESTPWGGGHTQHQPAPTTHQVYSTYTVHESRLTLVSQWLNISYRQGSLHIAAVDVIFQQANFV